MVVSPLGVVPKKVEGADPSLEKLVEKSLAPNTWKTYMKEWKKWEVFRRNEGGSPVQCLWKLLGNMWRDGAAKGRAATLVAAVSFITKLRGEEDPTKVFAIRRVLKGWSRAQPRGVDKREPLDSGRVKRLVAALGAICRDRHEVLLFKAAFTLAFAGAFRLGELVSTSKKGKDGLQLEDTKWDDATVKCLIRKSKTDQNGKGAWVTMLRKGGPICPVGAVKDYLVSRGAEVGAFLKHRDGSALSRFQFCQILKRTASAAGLGKDRIGSHSFRIGAASEAAAAGSDEGTIKRLGRWKSNAFRTYIRPLPY
ncbi:integrase/recombinase xerD homolog [Rhinoderma darwinii]|uniref:integrase/recombinase xerD homolog n=1 Tax=Rhinoderma darwinii TaxID=43563 RepID=UPI003F678427